MTDKIRQIHQGSRGTYGVPRIHAELMQAGTHLSRKRVARLMRKAGLAGVSRRRQCSTARRAPNGCPAPDLVQRDFSAQGPNQLCVADITYIPTIEGFLYLAVILDARSRRIVGWAMAAHLQAELVLCALEMALWRRRSRQVIHHSDQGCQYTSLRFGGRCKQAGVRPSMGSVGDCFDNAMRESFFAALEYELIARNRFLTREHARREVFEYIEGWYNPHRLHSALDYRSPERYEKEHHQAA